MNRPALPAWIGIGANLGDARATVELAIAEIAQLAGCQLVRRSSLYRSAPIDAGGNDYVNAVVQVTTTYEPEVLLDELIRIEARFGRQRPYPNAPRTLDLDLLMVDALQIVGERLTVPHPRMHLRAFVLVPLLEIAPDICIPGHGRAAMLVQGAADQSIGKLDDRKC